MVIDEGTLPYEAVLCLLSTELGCGATDAEVGTARHTVVLMLQRASRQTGRQYIDCQTVPVLLWAFFLFGTPVFKQACVADGARPLLEQETGQGAREHPLLQGHIENRPRRSFRWKQVKK